MKKRFLALLLLVVISCQKEEDIIELPAINLTKVSFLKSNNSSLSADLEMEFDGDKTFHGYVEFGTNLSQLVATYTFEGNTVFIGVIEQTSSVTKNDFSKEVVLTVRNNASTGKDYNIRVMYYTGLPIVYINTLGQEVVSKEEYISAEVSVYGGLDYVDIDETAIQIRGRGNTTWDDGSISKKPYQIKFADKTEVLGMPDDRRWVLLAEYWDRSLVRNMFSYEIGKISNFDYSPTGRFVELFINNQPAGTYVIAQKIEESKNRVNIGDTGYLIEIDQRQRIDEDDVYFEPPIFRQKMEKFWWSDTIFNIKEPDIEQNSTAYKVIKNHVDDFENTLFGNNFKDPDVGYRSFIDVDSFVDWYLINEMGKSVDAYGYASVFFTYEPGGTLKMGPIWDFDLSYGNADYNANSFFIEGNWISEHPWFDRLLQDEYFKDLVSSRYLYYYEKKDQFIDIIQGFSNKIKRSQKLNYEQYQNLGEPIWNNSTAIFETHDEEVEYLQYWVENRMNWMRGNLN